MSSAQERGHHWKAFINTENKKKEENILEKSSKNRKYTPLKDRSIEDSRIFEKSREKSKSSFYGLNRSRDAQIRTSNDKKMESKLASQKTPIKNPQPTAISSTPIKNDELKGQSLQQSNLYLSKFSELQKQFQIFKQKVMKLLQEQEQQIHLLAKEIQSACKMEIEKFMQNSNKNYCPNCKTIMETSSLISDPQKVFAEISSAKNQSEVKQIEDIKHQLEAKMKNNPAKTKIPTKLEHEKISKQLPKVCFEEIHQKFASVFEIFRKINEDNFQFQELSTNYQNSGIISEASKKDNVFTRKSSDLQK